MEPVFCEIHKYFFNDYQNTCGFLSDDVCVCPFIHDDQWLWYMAVILIAIKLWQAATFERLDLAWVQKLQVLFIVT